jgi:hypothetical protein
MPRWTLKSLKNLLLRQAMWLNSLAIRIVARILVVEYIVGFVFWYATADGLKDRSGTPLGADFLNVYAAGIMAMRGQAAEVYDWPAHRLVEQVVAGFAAPYYAWHYPPMFLAVAALLASLPYLSAFVVYVTAGFVTYVAIIRRIAPPVRESLWALAAFPGVFVNISNGQNGFITVALFGAGLLELERRPWLAGALFGLLCYKPQFFAVIPLMLAFGGYGRAVLASLLSTVCVIAASWVTFGMVTWQAFFASTPLTQMVVEQGTTGWQKIQSVFAMVRMWGGGVTLAYSVQATVGLLSLLAAAFIWQRKAALPIRAAVLCAAMLLTTPYMLDYDLVILAVPLAYLARQGIETNFRPYEKIILAALWLLPLLARSLGNYHITLTPPLLILLMGLCLTHVLRPQTPRPVLQINRQ